MSKESKNTTKNIIISEISVYIIVSGKARILHCFVPVRVRPLADIIEHIACSRIKQSNAEFLL